ncbi:uncharacterized protein LOC130500126 [Raphanus sativus]|uniref:Uncharacterized protein LOC130500126 n=1 Tax=Raphanus sativus TaxID=3726 RepID=A0A9W3CH97_RAPSA|nr:uncharacterized protein LOC130500126 [Raphanus sativus]
MKLRSLENNGNSDMEDVSLWRRESGFKSSFSSAETWWLIREENEKCVWAKGVWFSQATPKFAFMVWLANLNRLSTMDRVFVWNPGIDDSCVLCKNARENREHLFFECYYSGKIWESLAKGIMGNSFTNSWSAITHLIAEGRNMDRKKLFCLRYAFHIAMYGVWRERNIVRHGEKITPVNVIKKMMDKGVRNKLSLLRSNRVKGMEDTLQIWFRTRV